MTWQIVAAIAIFVAAYALIATEKISRVVVVLAGAAGMVILGATDAQHAFFSEDSGIDWNVIFLLLGMMIIVGILRHSGVFEFLAIRVAKIARGRPFVLMVLLVVLTAVLSALLDNVTTVLLVAPVTLLVCERLGLPPVPFLIAEVMASNIGGTATLIGDPPNIIIASRSGLDFLDFLANLGPIIAIVLVVFVLLCRVMFRHAFRYDPERAALVMALDEREAITDRSLLVKGVAVVALVILGFTLHSVIAVEPSVIALLGAGLLILLARMEPREYFGEVEWETLLFFAGLFVMVGSLIELGVISAIGEAAVALFGTDYLAAATVLLAGSAVISGIVDNIPYVATMAPLVNDFVDQGGPGSEALWWALALGADLGGNATAIGASANVVVLGIARRNGHPISFWGFTKYGLMVTAVTVAVCWPYLWLRYYA